MDGGAEVSSLRPVKPRLSELSLSREPIMRKKARIVAIALAAGGVFFYLAASYAVHHPESLLTQCILTSFHLGPEHNPFYQVGRAVGRTAFRVAQAEIGDNDMTTEEQEALECVPPDPEPLPDDAPREPSIISPEQRDFIIATIQEQLPSVHTELNAKSSSGDSSVQLFGEPQLCSPPLPVEDDYPKVMPHCTDEDVPEHMPCPAESKSSSDPLFKFWLDLFESAAKEANDMSGAEPQEESHYFHDEEPPQCLEDPAYQHQYPGCPYTGKCPGKESTTSPKIIDPAPTVKPKNANKRPEMKQDGNADPTGYLFDPKKYELPARLRQLLPGDSTEAEEEPSHPEVDTMEFRPTDARPGEFNPKPM